MQYFPKITMIACIFFATTHPLSAQKNDADPVEVTPEILGRIKLEIENGIPLKRRELLNEKENVAYIEFKLDTFRVEQLMDKRTKLDYTTKGMVDAMSDANGQYDSLMNKYYKKLMGVLQGDDRKVLIQAQRAWLVLRENDLALIRTISKDQYSGGGTVQLLNVGAEALNVVKSRTITLFMDYVWAAKIENE